MSNARCEMDMRHVLHHINIVKNTMGLKWFARKIREEEKRRNNVSTNSKNHRHTHLLKEKAHPLIEWEIEFEKLTNESKQSGILVITESIVNYLIFGKSLEKGRDIRGFEKHIKRLKMKEEFFSSAFEIEVAAGYVARGCEVEFMEECGERTPDLKVVDERGDVLWVECKCRDKVTERDKSIDAIWNELESSIVRELSPKNINLALVVKSLKDPERGDISDLLSFIFSYIEKAKVGVFGEPVEVGAILDPTGKYHIALHILSEPNKEIELQTFSYKLSEKLDRESISFETRTDEDKKIFVSNPMVVGFKNAILSDNISGIVNGFKSAVGQLPKEGPGIVWIRVPDNSWNANTRQSFEQVKSRLKSELTGTKNQRVNTIYLMTKVFHKTEGSELGGLECKPLFLELSHDNPRTPSNSVKSLNPIARNSD